MGHLRQQKNSIIKGSFSQNSRSRYGERCKKSIETSKIKFIADTLAGLWSIGWSDSIRSDWNMHKNQS